jgi:hypothetical protein
VPAVISSRLTSLLLAVVTGVGTVSAQTTPPFDTAALAAVIDSAPRIRVRLATGWAGLDSPRLQRDSLHFLVGSTLDRGGRPVALLSPLALGDVREIRIPAGHRTGKGAALGAGIGAGLGLVVAVGAASEPQCLGCPTAGEGFLAVPIVALLGAGVGALIGSASTHWLTVYRSP